MDDITKIFISYRRADNSDFVERIRDWFTREYARENVFMDFDSLPPSTLFAQTIREKVIESDVMVIIVGPMWLDLLREKIEKGEDDYVRIEVTTALENGIHVAPICIKGASEPSLDELPDDLQPLLKYNFAYLNSGKQFLDNIDHVIRGIEGELNKLHPERQTIKHVLDENSDEIFFVEPQVFEKIVTDHLENDRSLTIKRYLQKMVNLFWNIIANSSEEDSVETAKESLLQLLDNLTVLSLVSAHYEAGFETDIVLAWHRIFLKAAKFQFPIPQTLSKFWVWWEVGKRIYVIGCLLLRDKKYNSITLLLQKQPEWEYGRDKEILWLRYIHIMFSRSFKNSNLDYVQAAIKYVHENQYFKDQFFNDDDYIISNICQFDFIQCVHTEAEMRNVAFPSFGRYDKAMTMPIIEDIVRGGNAKEAIPPLSDIELASTIYILDRSAHRQFFKYFGWQGEWPIVLREFFDKNPPPDNLFNQF